MMQKNILYITCLIVLLGGCGRPTPDDLPRLYPCTVTILSQSGEPVTEAGVVATNDESKWAGIGLTDERGRVSLKTSGMYPGMPVGDYKILVTKYDVIGRGENVEPVEKLILDKSFSKEESTPLEMHVEAKKRNDATFKVW